MPGHHHKKHGSKKAHKNPLSVDLENHNGDHSQSLSSPESLESTGMATDVDVQTTAGHGTESGILSPTESVETHMSPRKAESFSDEAKLAHLMELNTTLLKKVKVLRLERDELLQKVLHIEEQLSTVKAQTIDAQQAFKIELETVQSKMKELEEEKKVSEDERVALESKALAASEEERRRQEYIESLKTRKTELETALQDSSRNLSETLARILQAEQDAVDANERIAFLTGEVEKISLLHGKDASRLEKTNRQQAAEVESLHLKLGIVEKELQQRTASLADSVEEADDLKAALRSEQERVKEGTERFSKDLEASSSLAKNLEDENTSLKARVDTMAETLAALRNELKDSQMEATKDIEKRQRALEHASEHSGNLEDANSKLQEKARVLEITISSLENELSMARVQVEETLVEIQKERVGCMSLQNQISTLQREKNSITTECESLQISAKDAEEKIVSLESQVSNLTSLLDQETSRLETAFASATEHSENLGKENRDLFGQVEFLETQVFRLQQDNNQLKGKLSSSESTVSAVNEELKEIRSVHNSITRDFHKEREGTAGLQVEVSVLYSEKLSLEGELQAARSSVKDLQELLKGARGHAENLQKHLSSLVDEKKELIEANTALEEELTKLNSSSADALTKLKEEAALWKGKAATLENVLEDIKTVASSSEQKVWQLPKELQSANFVLEKKKFTARNYAWPAASATSALAVVGILAFLRFSKRR